MSKGVFTDNFVRIDTNDGVSGVMILKRKDGNLIDLSKDKSKQIKLNTKEEAKELIKLIEDGMWNL